MRTPIFVAALSAAVAAQTPHSSFESPQTHALDVSADGLRMVAVNTPDARISYYSLADAHRPTLLREIAVAAEPVAVRMRNPREAWVVCHLADMVQVVDLEAGTVVDTLRLGDEPADVAFAGGKVFVTLAAAAEVAVVDPVTRGVTDRVALHRGEPRWLLASADGTRLWVAAHHSGNRTTLVPANRAPAQPDPTNPLLPRPPQVGLIVDAENPEWRHAHGLDVADHDVFEIDVVHGRVLERFEGVGTTLFGMAERVADRSLWVANTDARNLVRYEPALRGHVVDNRVTRIDRSDDPDRVVQPIDLNPGLDYGTLPDRGALSTALAQPTDVAWSPDQEQLYVASFGTDRIGILDPQGRKLGHIPLTAAAATDRAAPRDKRGPRALAHHPGQPLLYVMNRLSNSISVIDTARRAVLLELGLPDPTPAAVREGRGFLYDAMLSGNGTASCASCHVDGRDDGLAWDLGDPGGTMTRMTTQNGASAAVHPMKGPMLTQTLQGIDVGSVLHWRGEKRGFASFNASFHSLLGGAILGQPDMQSFQAFVATLRRGPNPNRNLDDSLPSRLAGGNPNNGRTLFHTGVGVAYYFSAPSCATCHQTRVGTSAQPIDSITMRLPQAFRAATLSDVHRRTRRLDPTTGQVTTGFGLSFDGHHADVTAHLSQPSFGALRADQKADLQAFVLAFDTGTAPIVGHSVSLDAANVADPDVLRSRDMLLARAAAGDCDVVARGVVDGVERGLSWDAAGSVFRRDRSGEAPVDLAEVMTWIAGTRARLTLMGVPRGEGIRYALDRDHDGRLDGDARNAVAYGASTGSRAPRLCVNGPARLGDAGFAVVVEGLPAAGQSALWLSNARVDLDLGGLRLLVDPGYVFGFGARADALGTALLRMPLPDDPALDGQRLTLQALMLDGAAVAASRGLEVTLLR